MAKRLPGKHFVEFDLYGLTWEVRVLPSRHKLMDGGKTAGLCYADDRLIYLSDSLSNEQMRTTLAHEIQHAIEDHSDVDYALKAPPDVADRCTDQVARSWLYLMRANPELVAYFCGQD